MKYINRLYVAYTDAQKNTVRVPAGATLPEDFVPAYKGQTMKDFNADIMRVGMPKVSRARRRGERTTGPVAFSITFKSGKTRVVGNIWQKNVENLCELMGTKVYEDPAKTVRKLNKAIKAAKKDGEMMPLLGNTKYFMTEEEQAKPVGEQRATSAHWLTAIEVSDELGEDDLNAGIDLVGILNSLEELSDESTSVENTQQKEAKTK